MKKIKHCYRLIPVFSFLFLFGCAQQTGLKEEKDSLLPPAEAISQENAQLLVSEGKEQKNSKQNRKLLQASYIYARIKDNHKADSLLESINPESLKGNQKALYHLIKSEILFYNSQDEDALDILNKYINPDQISIALQKYYTQIKSEILFFRGEHLKSVQERLYISPLLGSDELEDNNNRIWNVLSHLTKEQTEKALKQTSDKNLKEWLELSFINKAYQHDIDKQNEELEIWLEKTKNSDLKDNLPETIKLIKRALNDKPNRIVVMLPESGAYAKSAESIKLGYLSQYYRGLNPEGENPEILFIDTSDSAMEARYSDNLSASPEDTGAFGYSIVSDEQTSEAEASPEAPTDKEVIHKKGFELSYQDAVDLDPDLIIGPINKKYIESLMEKRKLKIPTLCLNYVENNPEAKYENLFQFGLSPEDEIKFIVDQAYLRNYKRAAILTPESAWGKRLSDAFNEEWRKRGGQTVSTSSFTDTKNMSSVIETMLNIDQSKRRFKKLYWYSEGKTLFYARRRQDLDFIFLISSPEEARQIMPIFSFHDASDIPVYSTSNVYSGKYNSKDKDLNRLYFSEIPVMLNPDDATTRSWKNQDYRYKRLVAMGMDVFDLSIRLKILEASEQNELFGRSGKLTMNKDKEIVREPVLARFRGSAIKVQPKIY